MTISSNRIQALCLLGITCLLLLSLAGCAASRAYRQGTELVESGDVEAGLMKLEEAVRSDPSNAEYRIALASRRARALERLLAGGERALADGELDLAEQQYRLALRLDARHPMARQGVAAVQQEARYVKTLAEVDGLIKKGAGPDLVEAAEKLREILAASPRHPGALALKDRLNQAQQATMRPEVRLAATYRKPITLEFRDAPIKSVFDFIAKLSGLNFYFDKEVRSDLKATVLAKDTSIEDAVHLVLVSNQLEQKVLNGNAILIYPSTPAKLKEHQTLMVRSFYVVNADVKAVANTIKTIVKTKDIVFDERVGVIIVRDTPQAVRMAERIVALQDITDPEVMLEVEVMEIKRSRLLELGIQWPSQLTMTPISDAGPWTFSKLRSLKASSFQLGSSTGHARLNARKEDQDSNILANPRIRVRNREKAKILIGDKVPVITSTSTATGFSSESVSYIDVGLKLEVEPTVYLDDEVAIKVNLEVSNLVREITSKSGALSYQIGTRGANTILRLKDGETQILAGLINDEDRSSANKVPGLGEIPILGRLFGSQKDDTQRNEILLSITPRVVRGLRRPDLSMAEFESGTESNIGAESVRLAPLLAGKKEAVEGSGAADASGGAASRPAGGDNANQAPAGTAGDAPSFTWQVPNRVKVGDQVSAVLKVNSQAGVSSLPLLLGFDPQYWEVVNVMELDFLKQKGGATTFSSQVDAKQGRVVIAATRQAAGAPGAPGEVVARGAGELLAVSLRALKPGAAAMLQVLSAAPDPMPQARLALPVEQAVRIEP